MFSLGDKIELKHRSKLRYDPKVIDALSSIWSYMEKNEDGYVEKEEYCNLLVRIAKVVAPHLTESAAKEAVEEDWVEDSHGGNFMTYNLFCDGIFELTDLWCPGSTAVEYEHFATSLLNRILVKENEEEGSVIHPSIGFAFVPEKKKVKDGESKLHWANTLSAENIQDPGEAPGIWYETVSFDDNVKTNHKVITRFASFPEMDFVLKSTKTPPFPIRTSQSVSNFWTSLEDGALEKADHALIQERHISLQRRLEVDNSEKKEETKNDNNDDNNSSDGGERKNFRKLFQAIGRKVGKICTLKQYILERHLLMYGSDGKQKLASAEDAEDGSNNNMETNNFRESTAPKVEGMVVPIDPDEIVLDPYLKHLALARNARNYEKSIWVTGKRNVGTENLASRLSKEKGLPLISHQHLINTMLADAAKRAEESGENEEDGEKEKNENAVSKLELNIVNAIQSGKQVPESDINNHIIALIVNYTKHDEGYVLEGYPRTKEDVDKINEELKKAGVTKGFEPYDIIVLHASDADLAQKRLLTKLDMENGNITSEYDRKEIIFKATEERKTISQQLENEKLKDEEEIDEDLISELEETLENLVIPSEADLSGTLPVIDGCNFVTNSEKELSSNTLLSFNRYTPGRTFTISALQSNNSIFNEAVQRLEAASAPYGRNGKIIRPVALPLPEDLVGSDDVAAKQKYLLFGEIEGAIGKDDEEYAGNNLIGKILSGEQRQWSRWGTVCPVSKEVVRGDFACAAMYQNTVYVMATPENLELFLASPKKYVSSIPMVDPKMKLAILSPVLGGGETAAKFACDTYNLKLISCQTVIEERYKNPGEVVFNQKIIESLASGASLPDDILSRLIMQEVRKTEDEIAKSNAYNGWVVVGFPLLKSQGELLVEANFKPDQVIVLDAPEDEEEWVKLMTTRQTAVVVDEIKTVYPTEFERENYINESNAIVEVFSGAEIKCSRMPCKGDMEDLVGWMKQLTNPFHFGLNVDDAAENDVPQGRVLDYCPVSLKLSKQLVPGKDDFAVQYNHETYKCFDEVSMSKFTADPEAYLPQGETNDANIKPLILIVGPYGDGKGNVIDKLGNDIGIDVLDVAKSNEYQSLLSEIANRRDAKIASLADGEELEEEETEEIPNEQIVNIIVQKYNSSVKGCILSGDTNIITEEVLNLMISSPDKRIFPSLLIPLEIDSELAGERLINLPGGFQFKLPPKEEEEGEDAIPLTKAEIKELRESQWEEEKGRLIEMSATSNEKCESLKGILEENGVEISTTVMANVSKNLLFNRLKSKINAYFTKLPSKLSSTRIPNEEEDSNHNILNLLNSGYHTLSRFGPYCPVTLLKHKKRIKSTSYPVVYKSRVYLCSTEETQQAFASNPVFYCRQKTPLPIDIGISCAVIGAPKSGKTALATAISNKYDMVYLTPSSVVEWCYLQQASNTASNEVRKIISSGKAVDGALFVQVLKQRVTSSDCVTKGYVLDDFPRTLKDAKLMTENDLIIPSIVFQMKAKASMVMKRAANDHKVAINAVATGSWEANDSSKSGNVINRLREWNAEKSFIVAQFKSQYENVKPLAANVSRFSLANKAFNILNTTRKCYGEYVNAKWNARPAPIKGIAINSNIKYQNVGYLGMYCPVQWQDDDRLCYLRPHAHAAREYGVELFGKYYFCSGPEELKKVRTDPKKYLGATKMLPQKLPSIVRYNAHIGNEKRFELELKGYCPVTFKWGKGPRDWDSIIEADPMLLVKYDGKTYGFSSIAKRKQFMERPWEYVDQSLPAKLPPKAKPLKLEELRNGSVHGVLAAVEQSLSDALQRALVALGNTGRIKHPSTTVENTAIKYLSLYLKANNPHANPRIAKKYRQKLEQFVDECRVGDRIKKLVSGGSAIKAIRSIQSQNNGSLDQYSQLALQFEKLCSETHDEIIQRYLK